MTTLRLMTIGNSTGVILPGTRLDRLRVGLGDARYVVETPTGFERTPYDPGFAEQIHVADAVMREDRDALRRLAEQ